MKKYLRSIFLDTSDINIIKKWNKTGIIDGITTNPQILLNEGVTKNSYFKIIKDICKEMGDKSVSVELTSDRNDWKKQLEEAKILTDIADNITIKIPLDPTNMSSLEIMHYLAVDKNVSVNATVLMNFEQLILAAKAMNGTTKDCFVSLFWGRSSEDWSMRSSENYAPKNLRMGNSSTVDTEPSLIGSKILEAINLNDNLNLIVGSVRSATMVGEALAIGTNIVTVPPDILEAMMYSKRGIETLKQFDEAWNQLESK
jgi:transaldolase